MFDFFTTETQSSALGFVSTQAGGVIPMVSRRAQSRLFCNGYTPRAPSSSHACKYRRSNAPPLPQWSAPSNADGQVVFRANISLGLVHCPLHPGERGDATMQRHQGAELAHKIKKLTAASQSPCPICVPCCCSPGRVVIVTGANTGEFCRCGIRFCRLNKRQKYRYVWI